MICVLTQYGGWFSPGAAAAGGQAGQCEQRSSSDHYREVHISSQVQKGELISQSHHLETNVVSLIIYI